MNLEKLKGILLVVFAAMLWGSTGTAQSFVSPEGLNAFWVAAGRIVFSLFLLIPVFFSQPRPKIEIQGGWQNQIKLFGTSLLAAIALALCNIAFFNGVREIGVALGAAVTVGSAPIWAGILSVVLLKRRPSNLWLLGMGIAVIGGILMSVTRAQSASVSLVGFLFCLGAGFVYSLYAFMAQRAVKTFGVLHGTTLIFVFASLFVVPLVYSISGAPTWDWTDLLVLLYLGVIATGVSYLAFSKALEYITASTSVAFGLIEPISAFVLATLIVKEPASNLSILGLGLILLGLLIILKSDHKR